MDPLAFFESRTATPSSTGATSTHSPLGVLKLLFRQPTSTQLPPLLLKLLFLQIILTLSARMALCQHFDELPGLSLGQSGLI